MTLLMAAIGLGIVLILISMTFSIVLNFKKKNIGEAILSQNGLCGVTFYVAVIVAALGMLTGQHFVNIFYILILIFLYKRDYLMGCLPFNSLGGQTDRRN